MYQLLEWEGARSRWRHGDVTLLCWRVACRCRNYSLKASRHSRKTAWLCSASSVTAWKHVRTAPRWTRTSRQSHHSRPSRLVLS